MAKMFVGSRIRRLRTEREISQSTLAEMLGISASYLNQIEHDARPLSVPVLMRITAVFGLDETFFTTEDNARLIAELQEVLLHDDAGAGVPAGEIADMANAHPELARAMVNTHRRYRNVADKLAIATENRNIGVAGPPGRSLSMPHEEVRDYFYQRQNYLHELDTAAEDFTNRVRMHRGEVRDELAKRLHDHHDVTIIRRVDLPDGDQHRYDPTTRTLELSAHLRKGQQSFRMATELAFLEFGELLQGLAEEGGFSSPESRSLGIRGIANYFAAAVLLPYTQFHGTAEDFRYDIDRLSAFFSVGFEVICHRLSTLQRPNRRGVPFSFVRVDRAGNMSKRQSATGFHFTSTGGTCPLWTVYETFSFPGKLMRQVAAMPDGHQYLWVAKTISHATTRFGQPGKMFAIGLGCETRHARRLVYSEGLNLDSTGAATPIGAGCRVCERPACAQRAFPPINRPLNIDEHRSGAVPYLSRD